MFSSSFLSSSHTTALDMSGSQVPPVNPEKEEKDEEVEKKEEVEEKKEEEGTGDREEGEDGGGEEKKAGGEGKKEEVQIFGEDSVRREHKAL